jgi:hypothetical protein
MGVEIVTPAEVAASAVGTLGLDVDAVDITSPEALAASLRRAASFLCPVAPRVILRTVNDALGGLPGYTEETHSELETALDAMVAVGDLLEVPAQDDIRQRQLFLGPPAFVRRDSGLCLIFGIRADGMPLVSDDLAMRVEHEDHVRLLRSGESLTERLAQEGLIELRADQWLKSPPAESAAQHLEDYKARLGAMGDSGPLDGVRLIDPTRPPTFYKGRWREPKKTDSGLFVARRPQGYGAELWCVVEVVEGDVRRGIDLPPGFEIAAGADYAWRLQAAIDSLDGTPQRFALRPGSHGSAVLDLFSPVPSWVRRRLDVVATPIVRSRAALFSYGVPSGEVEEEVAFLKEMMWMAERSAEGEP